MILNVEAIKECKEVCSMFGIDEGGIPGHDPTTDECMFCAEQDPEMEEACRTSGTIEPVQPAVKKVVRVSKSKNIRTRLHKGSNPAKLLALLDGSKNEEEIITILSTIVKKKKKDIRKWMDMYISHWLERGYGWVQATPDGKVKFTENR